MADEEDCKIACSIICNRNALSEWWVAVLVAGGGRLIIAILCFGGDRK